MKLLFFAFSGNEILTHSLAKKCNAEIGDALIRNFPDGESYVKINTEVKNRAVVLVCTLNNPDEKTIPLYLLAQTAKDLGAKSICLVTPYLAYMRQDKRFNVGEGVTSTYFAKLISSSFDSLVTIDPHLHRIKSLNEIYSIPAKVLHAADEISIWIKNNISNPVLVGPDEESKQWVSQVALKAAVPFIILEKTRKGDTDVEVSIPHLEEYKNHTPVLVDDIISTARTMIATVIHLKNAGMKRTTCIGVHGIFASNAYTDLIAAGAGAIVTTNTIIHPTNRIDLSYLIASAILD